MLIAENYLAQHATYYWKMYQEFALAAVEKQCYTTVEVLKKIAGDAVVADNFYAMYQMTELLFAQGLEDLAFIGSVDATSRYPGISGGKTA